MKARNTEPARCSVCDVRLSRVESWHESDCQRKADAERAAYWAARKAAESAAQ